MSVLLTPDRRKCLQPKLESYEEDTSSNNKFLSHLRPHKATYDRVKPFKSRVIIFKQIIQRKLCFLYNYWYMFFQYFICAGLVLVHTKLIKCLFFFGNTIKCLYLIIKNIKLKGTVNIIPSVS